MNAVNLFAVKLFVSAVSSQVTCLRDVVIDPFAENVIIIAWRKTKIHRESSTA